MATKIVLHGAQAWAVWDDRFRPIYDAMGELNVQRATEVEFDHGTGEWTAWHLASATIIARGKSRSAVIEQEVEWLEANGLQANGLQANGLASNELETNGREATKLHSQEIL